MPFVEVEEPLPSGVCPTYDDKEVFPCTQQNSSTGNNLLSVCYLDVGITVHVLSSTYKLVIGVSMVDPHIKTS